ncbi:autotransporter domain-containing protein [Aquisalinus flavus]|uniref:Autotransporter domain-containing protein n=1 Tax=Aquisalinus flavus TaxID=1526572 RepID=A0A8J2V5P2_9PROT|nr:autotransporter domain-containing protein [Aquisalinus flavus]MBD0426257.1 autotransporter domain-containing protein [Aquisalinus flavus]UNE48171.1 autotransporter domain-containing protein [Aquisalinus flavus]GGD09379.1 hypothetical protein GCM10011342_17800 [Aquisalinus flavus]
MTINKKLASRLGAGVSALALAAMAVPANAELYRDDVGDEGSQDYAAYWDGVVQIYLLDNLFGDILFNCTGSLINPRTVISAAHCFNNLPSEEYGPDTLWYTPIIAYGPDTFDPLFNWIGTGEQFLDNRNGLTFGVDVILHPDAEFGNMPFPAADVALIGLQDPIYTIPSYAMLFSPVPEGAIEDGLHTVGVGYGTYGPGSGTGIGINGKRRAGENMLGLLASQNDFVQALAQNENLQFGSGGASNQLLYWIDFDLPGREGECERTTAFGASNSIVCSDWDGFSGTFLDSDTVVLPGPSIDLFPGDALPFEFATAGGDSGGPLFADQLADFPLILGVLSGGFQPGFFHAAGQSYGEVSYYNPLFTSYQFISENNPYKYVSALEGDGNWSDPTRWIQTLDPNYFVYDSEGNLVNGLPSGDEGGVFQERPTEGTVFDTDVQTYDTADAAEGEGDGMAEVELAGFAGAREDASISLDTGLTATAAVSRGDGLGGGLSGTADLGGIVTTDLTSEATGLSASTPALDRALSEVSTLTGLEQSLTGPGSTNFVPDNFYGARGETFVDPAQFFEVTLNAAGTTTLDMDVEIDKLTLNGADTGLDIASDWSMFVNINTEVFDGLLNVDGSLLTREVVLWGGALTGDGTMTLIDFNQLYGNGVLAYGTLFNIAGMVSPGDLDTTGTLLLDGDYIQTQAGMFLANIRNGESDLLDVFGSISLDGTLGVDFDALPVYGDSYDIMMATGDIIGGFDRVLTPQLQGVLYGTSSVDAGVVSVAIEAQAFTSFLAATGSENQLSIGNALDASRDGNYAGLSEIYGVVDYLPSGSLGNALDMLAPAENFYANNMLLGQGDLAVRSVTRRSYGRSTGSFSVATNVNDVQVLAAADGMRTASADGTAAFAMLAAQDAGSTQGSAQGSIAMDEAWSGFADITYSRGDTAGYLANDEEELENFSAAIGLERALSEALTLGLSGHYQDGDVDVSDGGYASSDGYSIIGYGDLAIAGPLSLSAWYGGGRYDLEVSRVAAGFGGAADGMGSTDVEQVLAGLELGYDKVTGNGTHVIPRAGLYFSEYDIDGYVESGGQGALSVEDYDIKSLQAKIGVDFMASHETGTATIRPFGGLSYVQELADDEQVVQASFANGATTPFAVTGADIGESWFEPRIGLEADINDAFSLSAEFSAMYGRDNVDMRTLRVGGVYRF